jgi:hypothetical protein
MVAHEDSLVAEATLEQMSRAEIDPWDDLVMPFIVAGRPVTTTEILLQGLKVPSDRLSKADTMRVASILRRHKWERKFLRMMDETGRNEPKWRYVPPDYGKP